VVTLETYESVHGVNGSSLPTSGSSVFGWIERDGLIANSATDDSEIVYYADTVHVHAEVHINPCYTWYVVIIVVVIVVVVVVAVVVVVVVR